MRENSYSTITPRAGGFFQKSARLSTRNGIRSQPFTALPRKHSGIFSASKATKQPIYG